MANATSNEEDEVHAKVYFLSREEKYQHEKPYYMRYDPGEGFPLSNITMNPHDVNIFAISAPVFKMSTWKSVVFRSSA